MKRNLRAQQNMRTFLLLRQIISDAKNSSCRFSKKSIILKRFSLFEDIISHNIDNIVKLSSNYFENFPV